MFKNARTFSSFSVDDVAAARRFYRDTLGLDVSEPMGQLQLDLAGGHKIFIYQKPDHQPATFTVLNIMVPNIADAVAALKERGVRFEIYDLPDLKTDPDGICRSDGEGPTIAWFKDPAGNILSVLEE